MKLKHIYRGYTDTMGLFREIEESCGGALTPVGVAIWMEDKEYELSMYGIPEEDIPGLMDVSDMIMRQKCARSTATQKP